MPLYGGQTCTETTAEKQVYFHEVNSRALALLLHIKHWYIKIDVYISIAVKVCLNNGLFQGGRSCQLLVGVYKLFCSKIASFDSLRWERGNPCEVIVNMCMQALLENDSQLLYPETSNVQNNRLVTPYIIVVNLRDWQWSLSCDELLVARMLYTTIELLTVQQFFRAVCLDCSVV